ncbi:hypothetical protein, partial [Variovorax beijingensis]|uniref:hypothetical protein n=1 Tax=Variovorax beijingensis TaxID=2496117 RepID=UPI003F6A2476
MNRQIESNKTNSILDTDRLETNNAANPGDKRMAQNDATAAHAHPIPDRHGQNLFSTDTEL